jgi:DNA invertase Pin-like site-specific DNA recombinase
MPKLLHARAPQDAAEEQKVRKLANSRHAPADWKMRARMIARSWDGLRTTQIAEELGCHPQTVRERFHRYRAPRDSRWAWRSPGRWPQATYHRNRALLDHLAGRHRSAGEVGPRCRW